MALTRKMLSAMEIPAEKIDEIINAHTETVNGLKEERDKAQAEIDQLKGSADELKKAQDELKKASDKIAKLESGDWEKKYTELKAEYESFKTDTENKATKTAKSSAYRKVLAEAGVSEKRIDSIMKVSVAEIDALELDDEGNAKDADKLTESVKENWADFIQHTHEKGADVANPPKNTGGKEEGPSRASALVAQYYKNHYGSPNKEV